MTGRTPGFTELPLPWTSQGHRRLGVALGACVLALLVAMPALSVGGREPTIPGSPEGIPSGTSHLLRAPSCPERSNCAPAALGRGAAAGSAPAEFLANRTMGWSEVTSPPAAVGVDGGMVADSLSGTAVVFGGVSSGHLVNSTFAYAESSDAWSTVSVAGAPSPRSDFAFALDPADGTGILFGGLTNLSTLAVSNATFAYNLTNARWTPETHGPAPPAREGAAFAVSSTLGIAFLYGGWNQNQSGTESITYSDLWELNLTTYDWTSVPIAGVRPPPLERASMLWDPATGRFEMFGGCYPCSSAVWQLDPTSLRWTELGVGTGGPSARAAASWAYDPVLRADLLFGGTNGGVSFNDTYVFYPANGSWVAETLPGRPTARAEAVSGFLDVPGNETWLLEGGVAGSTTFSDLWRLSTTSNVSILVRNASSLRPLSGAEVGVGGRSVGSTDANGSLNLTQVDAVGPSFVVTAFGYFTQNSTIWLPPGRLTNLTVDLVPEPPGSVFVTVFSSLGGPFLNASVNLTVNGTRINPVPTLTNASGDANFYGVPPGRVNVTVWAALQRSNYTDGTLVAGGQLSAFLDLVPDPLLVVTVLGRYPNGPLMPLDLASVLVNKTPLGFTDSYGVLTASTSAYGLTEITGNAPGYATASTPVLIPWTGTVDAALVLDSLPFGLVLVSVIQGKTGQAIPNVLVSAASTSALPAGPYDLSNVTGASGTTELSLPQGVYLVTATATGYLPFNGTSVTVYASLFTPLTIYLLPIPPARVNFLVRDAQSNSPIPGANVTLGGGYEGRTNASGFYNVTVPPGTYFVAVTASGYRPNGTAVVLFSYDNRTVVVNLTRLPPTLGPTAWEFALFPSGAADLWPFLVLPLLLVAGAFVYISVLRGSGNGEEAPPASRIRNPANRESGRPDDGTGGPAPLEPPRGGSPGA